MYESIITKVFGTLFMYWYLLIVTVLFHVAQILPYISCAGLLRGVSYIIFIVPILITHLLTDHIANWNGIYMA
jgi:hypothetical protein